MTKCRAVTVTDNSTRRYQEKITNQLTRLGASLDWSRVAFTMNDVSDASCLSETT
jgi:valyl-tRNA synthetase